MATRRIQPSLSPITGDDASVLMEILSSSVPTLLGLRTASRVNRRLYDLGYDLVVCTNQTHILRLELIRLDRQPFFSPSSADLEE